MNFEHFTAFIITGGFEFLVALILIFFIAIVRQNKLTISLFMICKLLDGLALIGLGLQGSSSCNLSANFSLALLFCAWLFLILSVSSFRGKLPKLFTLTVIFPAVIAAIIILFIDANGKLAVYTAAIMVVAIFIPAAIQLINHHKPFRIPILIAVCYIMFALVNIYRAIVVYHLPDTYNFFEFSGFDHWFILISLGLIVVSSLGFFLLIIESDKSSLFELTRLNKVAFEQSPLSIVTTDLDGAITYANPAFCRISGYSAEEVLHKKANVLQSGQTPNTTFVDLWETVTSGKVWYGEFINRKKNGEIYYEDVAIAPLKNEKGIINGYFSIKTDTSERRKNEQLIIHQNTELKEMDNTKNKLFSIIAHDLRGPVGTIMNLLIIAQNKCESGNSTDAFPLIKAAAGASKTSFELIENLLHWARSQFNSITVHPAIFDIVPIIKETLHLNENSFELKKITINLPVEDEAFVKADKEMIKTVLRNVISNAIKFTPESGTISVNVSKEEQKVIVSIKDSGIGIEPERLSTLFKFSENKSTNGTQGEKGTGLGLVLSHDFIQANGGKLWIESSIGEGTTLFFSLSEGKQ